VLAACSGPASDDDCGDLCVVPDPVRIGATLPLSGPLEPYGRAQLAGMERAVRETDEAGGLRVGVERRRVELLVRDDRGDPSIAGQWLLILIRLPEPVQALLGPCAVSTTTTRVAEARQVPLLAGCAPAGQPAAPAAPSSTWQLGPTEAMRAEAVLRALGSRGPVAVFLSPGHDAVAWTDAAAATGTLLLGPWGPDGAGRRTSWAEAVRQASGARAVVAVTDPPHGAALRRDLLAAGLRPHVLFATEAALPGAEPQEWARLGADLLTDLVAESPTPGVVQQADAVERAAADVTRTLLDAVATTGSARREEVAAALAAVDLRRPYRMARVTDAGLEPL
jgi:ABC-type branched-subunit amino acid transport system substrate-binding protein